MKESKFAALYAQGTVSPKVMKLCVIGAAGAGKTTLLETLRRNFMKWLFTKEKQEDDPTREYERTVGINVSTVDIPGVGRMSVYDHAGQKQFHKTHGLFFKASNAIFLLLVSLIRGGHIRTIEELIEEAQYWLAFLRASLEEECIPKVIIAASRADGYPDGGRLVRRVVSEMQRRFDGKVTITDESFLLDCRKSRSPEMKNLRVFLEKTRKEYLQQVLCNTCKHARFSPAIPYALRLSKLSLPCHACHGKLRTE
jgi:death-associated protein kinase